MPDGNKGTARRLDMKKIAVIGIVILISISVLFRGLYFSYDAYGFLAGLALFLVVYVFGKINKRESFKINWLYVMLGLLLVAAAALSFITAVNPRENLGNVLLYAELLVLVIVLYDYFHDKKQQLIQGMMLPVVLTGFLAAVVGLMSLTEKFQIWEVYPILDRVGSTFQYTNTAAIYFVVCCIFAVTMANASKSTIFRALMVGMGNTILFAFFMTGSRGGFLVGLPMFLLLLVLQPKGLRIRGSVTFICMMAPVFAAMQGFSQRTAAHDNLSTAKWLVISFVIAVAAWLLVHLLLRLIVKGDQVTMPRGSGFLIAAVVTVACVLLIAFRDRLVGILPDIIVSRVERLLINGLNEQNVLYRLVFDRDALLLLRDHWLLGLGGGGWKALYQSVQDHLYSAISVHNHYLQVFVDNGILAFLSFVSLVLFSAVGAFFSIIRADSSKSRTYAAGLFCGFLSLAVHSAIDFNLLYVSLLLLFWVMFTASTAGLPEKAKQPFISRWQAEIKGSTGQIALIIISAALFSIYSLYFAGSYNSQIAFNYAEKRDYKNARIYYEEALRLDPANSNYSYELAKVYRYYAVNTNNEKYRTTWLELARAAGEKSVTGNRYYPPHMKALTRIYLEMDQPLKALALSHELVYSQKYHPECYELLAESYLAAAFHYKENGDMEKAKELLEECLKIDDNPYLRRSGILSPLDIDSQEIISQYEHSDELTAYLEKARDLLSEMS